MEKQTKVETGAESRTKSRSRQHERNRASNDSTRGTEGRVKRQVTAQGPLCRAQVPGKRVDSTSRVKSSSPHSTPTGCPSNLTQARCTSSRLSPSARKWRTGRERRGPRTKRFSARSFSINIPGSFSYLLPYAIQELEPQERTHGSLFSDSSIHVNCQSVRNKGFAQLGASHVLNGS